MYDNVQDAQRYLDHSIIRIRKTPILVRGCYEVDGEVLLSIRYLRSGKQRTIPIKDKSLNFKPVPLGYGVDSRGSTFFAYRQPRRKWKQGLHQESLSFQRNLIGKVRIDSRLDKVALANTIQGRFKSFEEALEEGGVFHRFFQVTLSQLFLIH